MKAFRLAVLIVTAQLLWVLPSFAQDTYKAEPIGAPASSDIPKPLQDILEPKGTRLLNDKGTAVCEVWLRKSVPTQETGGGSSDIVYPALNVGTLVGVLHFSNGGSDFRGQTLKAGYYTLRYAQIPQDGNHTGVSTYRDFLLLSPAGADTQIDKALNFDALLKLSRLASGTGHPAVLSLIPATDEKALPAAVKDDQGHWAVQVQVEGKSDKGEQGFPIAIILVGQAEAA